MKYKKSKDNSCVTKAIAGISTKEILHATIPSSFSKPILQILKNQITNIVYHSCENSTSIEPIIWSAIQGLE